MGDRRPRNGISAGLSGEVALLTKVPSVGMLCSQRGNVREVIDWWDDLLQKSGKCRNT